MLLETRPSAALRDHLRRTPVRRTQLTPTISKYTVFLTEPAMRARGTGRSNDRVGESGFCARAVEGGAVGVGAGADDAFEAVAEGGGGAESDLVGDAIDGVVG